MKACSVGVALALLASLSGCSSQQTGPAAGGPQWLAQQQAQRVQEEDRENREMQAWREQRAKERARQKTDEADRYHDRVVLWTTIYKAPADYKAQIDSSLKDILKDPDSRKVEFLAVHGGVVCGSVNAKNSYGGYTGPQPFGAAFDEHSKLKLVRIFSDAKDVQYAWADETANIIAYGCGLKA